MYYSANHKLLIFGTTGYLAHVAQYLLTDSDMDVSDRELNDLIAYLSQRPQGSLRQDIADAFSKNSGKNLIFIEIESLCSKALQLPASSRLAPTISAMIADSSAIVCSEMKILADLGRSSDAQFMHNTGLLPMKNEILVNNYALASYPSFARFLPADYSKVEYIGEFRNVWNHGSTTVSYDYDTLHDNITIGQYENLDSVLFSYVMADMKIISQPFCLFITSLGMHDPYDEAIIADTPEIVGLLSGVEDVRDSNYLRSLYAFDRVLNRFLNYLKDNNLYDNTVIFITGDHEPRISNVSPMLHDDKVPFIILNSGIGLKCNDFQANQADIFPTILDVMDLHGEISLNGHRIDWRGFGQSLVRSRTSTLTQRDWDTSLMIVKGRLCR